MTTILTMTIIANNTSGRGATNLNPNTIIPEDKSDLGDLGIIGRALLSGRYFCCFCLAKLHT